MKPKILFIMHMPPPVHGAAMVGQYIHDSKLINQEFDCHYINLTTAKNLQDIGKVGMRKLLDFFKLLKKIRHEVKVVKPQLVYVTPNACSGAFYKDFVVVQMLKRLGCQVVVHYHNKGVATRQEKWLDNVLYKRFFKGIKVILLSECLYEDVKKYVDRGMCSYVAMVFLLLLLRVSCRLLLLWLLLRIRCLISCFFLIF